MGQRSRTPVTRRSVPAQVRAEEFDEEDDISEDGAEEAEDESEGGLPPPALDFAEDDDDVGVLNDPSMTMLVEPPMVGGRGRSSFMGQPTETIGMPSSPPLYASAANFPDVRKFMVYKMDGSSGNPISIGSISANCTEDGFIRHFYHSMPRPGEGAVNYLLRMVNSSGREVGAAIERPILDTHTTLRQLREEEKNAMNGTPGWNGMNVISGDNGAGVSAVTEELGRVVEQAHEFQQHQLDVAQQRLEEERARALESERRLADERVELAKQAGSIQQTTMERLIESDRLRADEVRKAQEHSSRFVLEMITTMSAQQRESMAADMVRRENEERARQLREREYFDRLLRDQEAKWQREREEARLEAQRREQDAKNQIELARLEMENRRKEIEAEALRRERDMEIRLRQAQDEREARDRRDREEREARERLERERFDRERQEERDRRERERQAEEARLQREREEARERETRREEERRREDERRREETQMRLKQMEEERIREAQRAERDAAIAREHAERMANVAAQEREALRLADERRLAAEREDRERRERAEREDREQRERDRQRAFDLEQARLAREAEQQREHQRSLIEMQRLQGGGGLERLGDIFKPLGLDPTEGLKRIFASEEGFGETVMKGFAAMAEGYLRAQQAKGGGGGAAPPAVRTVTIQTPEGPRVISEEAFRAMQARMAQAPPAPQLPGPPQVTPPGAQLVPPLPPRQPDAPASHAADTVPVSTAGAEAEAAPEVEATDVSPPPEYLAAQQVNVLTRSRANGLSTATARKMRKQAKELVARLGETDPAEWEPIVQAAMVTSPDLLAYLNAVTVWAAVVDAGATPDLAAHIVERLRVAEAQIRADLGATEPFLIFGEEDLAEAKARAAKAQAEQVAQAAQAAASEQKEGGV